MKKKKQKKINSKKIFAKTDIPFDELLRLAINTPVKKQSKKPISKP